MTAVLTVTTTTGEQAMSRQMGPDEPLTEAEEADFEEALVWAGETFSSKED